METVGETSRSYRSLVSQIDSLTEAVTTSEELAERLDQAVMDGDERAVLRLMHENGISEETDMTVVELQADRRLVIRWHGRRLDFCFEWEW